MQSAFSNMPPVVKNLLIINIICFLPLIVFNETLANTIYNLGAAHYFDSPFFKPWQVITYMFLHGGFMHIIFNMFALVIFGSTIEYTLGAKRFLNFYFICGIGGVALQMLIQAVEVYNITGAFTIAHPELLSSYAPYGGQDSTLFDIYRSSMVGASGAIFGLLLAFAYLYPNVELMILFIPVPIKAKYLMPVYMLIELYLGVKQVPGDSVAHFAHLGGALLGFIMLRIWGYKSSRNF